MDKELKKIVDECIEIVNTPEYKKKQEEWIKKFWSMSIMSDYALGLVAEGTFIELDNDIKDRK